MKKFENIQPNLVNVFLLIKILWLNFFKLNKIKVLSFQESPLSKILQGSPYEQIKQWIHLLEIYSFSKS